MKKSRLYPIRVNNPLVDKAISDIYNELNRLIDKTSLSFDSSTPVGSIRAVYDETNKIAKIEAKTSKGWIASPAQFNTKNREYKNIPKIDSEGSLLISNTKITSNRYLTTGPLTLDVSGDIELNADGGNVKIYDGADKHFIFDCTNTRMRIFDDTAVADYLEMAVGANGASTIKTVDNDGAAGHLTIAPDGNIILQGLDAEANTIGFSVGHTALAGSIYGEQDNYTILRLNEMGGASATDYFEINVQEHGFTQISTVDAAGANADLRLFADGKVQITASNDSTTGVFIDADYTGTTTASRTAFLNDVDQTGIIASGQSLTLRGMRNTVNTNSPTMVGTLETYGFANNVTCGTSGGQTAYGIYNIVEGADTNTGLYSKVTDGVANPDIKMVSSADTGDYCTISTTTHGATTIATVDDDADVAHLTLDADGDVVLDAVMDSNGGVFFKDSGTAVALMKAHHSSTRLLLYEAGGTSTDDYLEIKTEASAATTISTVDAAATAGHITLDADGDITLDAASGNIYVKNDGGAYTPGSDYEIATKKYVDGSHKWNFNTGSRWYTRYDNWYFPSTIYGINSVNWSSSLSSPILPIAWNDAYNPCIVVPQDCKINSYHFYGNFSSSQTYQVALMTGTPSYGSAGNTTLSQIGATQELVATGSIYNKLEQTGLSVSVSAGDIIIPCLRRTTTDTSTYYYFEFAMNIIGVVS